MDQIAEEGRAQIFAGQMAIAMAVLAVFSGIAWADPTLPTIGSAVYDVTVSNPNIDGGAVASTSSSDNKAVINAFIAYASSHGGGTVQIPAGTFKSGTVRLENNVNLNLAAGSTLNSSTVGETLVTANEGVSNIEISGSGIINGGATTANSSSNLVVLNKITNVEITGVSILNSAREHLVMEGGNNVTIKGITIADPGTLAAHGGAYLSNTDGMDYSGTNFLIENSSFNDGDDDIVAKPGSVHISNIVIQNDTIGAGHGINMGGGVQMGVSNFLVNHVTFNGTSTGLRMLAEDVAGVDGSGGGLANPVTGVTYENITMTNVATPIDLESDGTPSTPTDPIYSVNPIPQDSAVPNYDNVLFENITATGAKMAGEIEGINTTVPSISGITFESVNISANSQFNLWYAANVNYSGLTVTVPSGNKYFKATPVSGVWMYAVTPAPEPTLLALGSAGILLLLGRRKRLRRFRGSP